MARLARLSTNPVEVERRRVLFVEAYATTGNGEAAALAAGYAESQARGQAAQFMSDPALSTRARASREKWVAAQSDAYQRQAKALVDASDDAIAALQKIVTATDERTNGMQARVQAAVAILDRAGHKPVERVEQTTRWEDVTRELSGVDAQSVLRDALEEITASQAGENRVN